MPRKSQIHFPSALAQFREFGDRLRLARLRRQITTTQMAQRAGVTRATLYRAEDGDSGVGFGVYYAVLRVLGLQGDLDKLAADDTVGRQLQDMELPERRSRRVKGRV